MPQSKQVTIPASRHWQAHVKALERSGLSRAEYCRRHDLSYHAMTYWQRKLSHGDHSLPVLVQVPVFSPAGIKSSPVGNSGITVRLDDRISIELATEFSAVTFDKVLSILEAR
jgi:transposase-like protein